MTDPPSSAHLLALPLSRRRRRNAQEHCNSNSYLHIGSNKRASVKVESAHVTIGMTSVDRESPQLRSIVSRPPDMLCVARASPQRWMRGNKARVDGRGKQGRTIGAVSGPSGTGRGR